jgi:hypothetical protein
MYTNRGLATVNYRFKKGGGLEYRIVNADELGVLSSGFEALPSKYDGETKEDLLDVLGEEILFVCN